jgi:hypothetical protein
MNFDFLNKIFGDASKGGSSQSAAAVVSKAELMDTFGRSIAAMADDVENDTNQMHTNHILRFREIQAMYPNLITAMLAVDAFIKKHELDLIQCRRFFVSDIGGEGEVYITSFMDLSHYPPEQMNKMSIQSNDEILVDKSRGVNDLVGYIGDYIKKHTRSFILDEVSAIQYLTEALAYQIMKQYPDRAKTLYTPNLSVVDADNANANPPILDVFRRN